MERIGALFLGDLGFDHFGVRFWLRKGRPKGGKKPHKGKKVKKDIPPVLVPTQYFEVISFMRFFLFRILVLLRVCVAQ